MSETETRKIKFVALACGAEEVGTEVEKMRQKFDVVKEHWSSQMVQLQNPAANLKGISTGQPQLVTAVYVSIVFEVYEKIKIASA